MNTIVRVEHLTKTFSGPRGRVRALDDVSFEVSARQLAVVQGPSGCGKTTLLLLIGGLLDPDQGQVFVDGQQLQALSTEARARLRSHHIGYVFQQFHLVPYLSVRENVLTAALARPSAATAERANELIARFGLEARARHLPAELSTGERQRTALARALLNRPRLVLADEPTGNLDPGNADKVLEYLEDYANEGAAVLLVTHDPGPAQRCTHLLRLTCGRLNDSA